MKDICSLFFLLRLRKMWNDPRLLLQQYLLKLVNKGIVIIVGVVIGAVIGGFGLQNTICVIVVAILIVPAAVAFVLEQEISVSNSESYCLPSAVVLLLEVQETLIGFLFGVCFGIHHDQLYPSGTHQQILGVSCERTPKSYLGIRFRVSRSPRLVVPVDEQHRPSQRPEKGEEVDRHAPSCSSGEIFRLVVMLIRETRLVGQEVVPGV